MAEEASIDHIQRVGPGPGKLDDMSESDSLCKQHCEPTIAVAIGNHDSTNNHPTPAIMMQHSS